jgi:hypothetical protein
MDIKLNGMPQLQQKFLNLSQKTLNQAIADGINRTMGAVEQAELNAMENQLDKPTSFTMNALRVFKATPRKSGTMNTKIFAQPLQQAYLQWTVYGGTLDKTNLTPNIGDQGLNQYGNIPGKRQGLKGIINTKSGGGDPKQKFVGEITFRGLDQSKVFGAWQRYWYNGHRGVRLLVRVEEDATRQKRFDFFGVGFNIIAARTKNDVAAAVAKALAES